METFKTIHIVFDFVSIAYIFVLLCVLNKK
jgi:hypothetical protein